MINALSSLSLPLVAIAGLAFALILLLSSLDPASHRDVSGVSYAMFCP